MHTHTHTAINIPVGGKVVIGAHSVVSEQPLCTILSCFWKAKHFQIQREHFNYQTLNLCIVCVCNLVSLIGRFLRLHVYVCMLASVCISKRSGSLILKQRVWLISLAS